MHNTHHTANLQIHSVLPPKHATACARWTPQNLTHTHSHTKLQLCVGLAGLGTLRQLRLGNAAGTDREGVCKHVRGTATIQGTEPRNFQHTHTHKTKKKSLHTADHRPCTKRLEPPTPPPQRPTNEAVPRAHAALEEGLVQRGTHRVDHVCRVGGVSVTGTARHTATPTEPHAVNHCGTTHTTTLRNPGFRTHV